MKMHESLHLNGNKIHLLSLECARKRQIASLLPHAFRDLPFDLTVDRQFSLFIVGVLGGSQNKCSRRIFSSLSLPLPFPWKKKSPTDRRLTKDRHPIQGVW